MPETRLTCTFLIRIPGHAYLVHIEPDDSEGFDGFYAWCPDLPGVHIDGDTLEEAMSNVREAVAAYLASVITHGDVPPMGEIE